MTLDIVIIVAVVLARMNGAWMNGAWMSGAWMNGAMTLYVFLFARVFVLDLLVIFHFDTPL